MFGRRKLAAIVSEFLGAGVLTLSMLSVAHSQIGYPLFVAAAAGLAVMLFAFTVGDESGGHFNPAITIGQWVVGKVSTIMAVLYVIVQLFGGWVAYRMYGYLIDNHFPAIGGHFSWRVFITEAIGAGVFAFVFAATVYKGWSRAVSASFIGLGLTVGIVLASTISLTKLGSFGLLNPAVALGFRAWVWGTYVLGPVVGAIVGTVLYRALFVESDEDRLFGNFSMAAMTATSSAPAKAKPATRAKNSTRKK
jgi:aquaporin Z